MGHFLWLVYLNHNSLEEVLYEAHHIPVSRQPPRCFTEEYALTMTTMLCPQDSPFWSRDHRDILIKSSEINLHPRFPINANQIKWFKTHILFLDFDWCPIKFMLTLHFKWTSIGSLGWIALPSHSSLMKCEAFYLRKGWVERCSFPSLPELRIVHLAHRVTHRLSLWGHEQFSSYSIQRSSHSLHEHEVPSCFFTKLMLILDISEIFHPVCQVTASLMTILGFPIIDAL